MIFNFLYTSRSKMFSFLDFLMFSYYAVDFAVDHVYILYCSVLIHDFCHYFGLMYFQFLLLFLLLLHIFVFLSVAVIFSEVTGSCWVVNTIFL